MNAEQSTAYREGQSLGQLHRARGVYLPAEAGSEEAQLGYEAGWEAAFLSDIAERRGRKIGELNFNPKNQP